MVSVALAAAGCGGSDETSVEQASLASESPGVEARGPDYKGEPEVVIPAGPPPKELEIRELKKGTGTEVKRGDWVEIRFVAAYYEAKKKFETTWDNHELFRFPVGGDFSVKVLSKGTEGMRIGGRRELIAPADLVYGDEAAVYIVDLVKID
jgi:peptidylprolyl isomerase